MEEIKEYPHGAVVKMIRDATRYGGMKRARIAFYPEKEHDYNYFMVDDYWEFHQLVWEEPAQKSILDDPNAEPKMIQREGWHLMEWVTDPGGYWDPPDTYEVSIHKGSLTSCIMKMLDSEHEIQMENVWYSVSYDEEKIQRKLYGEEELF